VVKVGRNMHGNVAFKKSILLILDGTLLKEKCINE
jgi:hypothetical protein